MVSIEDINRMGSYGDIEGLINTGLTDPEPEVRIQSVIELINIGDEKFIDFLITTLESSDNHIGRTLAAEALGNTARILKENENIIIQQSLDKSVGPLIKALNDDSYEVRGLSSWALGHIGDPRAVEPLIKSLDDSDFIVRRNSVDALGDIGDPRAVNPLIKTLDDESFMGRINSIDALGKIADPHAIDPIIKTLGDHVEDVQDLAALVLSNMGNIAVEPLINALQNPNKCIQAYAASILGNIGDTRAVWPLIQVLEAPPVYYIDPHPDDPEWDVQVASAISLGTIRDHRAIEPLKRALMSSNPALSLSASEALKQMGVDGESLIKKQQLTDELETIIFVFFNSDNREERNNAVQMLAKIGEPAFEPILEASVSDDSVIRRKCCDALGLMGNPRAVIPLTTLLADSDRFVRRRAANALIRIGDERAVSSLINALNDPESKVRSRAATALGNIGDNNAVNHLINSSMDRNSSVREESVRALHKIGWTPNTDERSIKFLIGQRDFNRCAEIGEPAIIPLINTFNSDSETRNKAVKAIVKIGEPAINPLLNALNNPNPVIIRKACDALGLIGDPRAVIPLTERLNDPEKYVRRRAANALIRIGDERAVDPLINALNDSEYKVRMRAAEALGNIGDKKAIQPLEYLLNDERPEVVEVSTKAQNKLKSS